jgi:CAP12/Pycsar effector protein, TIR domain
MMVKRRIFVSATSNRSLDERRRALKSGLLELLRQDGYEPQEFFESGLGLRYAWNFDNVDRVVRRCVGAIVLGFPRWDVQSEDDVPRVGEYNHYEGAVALTYELPVLLMAEYGVADRGIVWTGGGRRVTFIPKNADARWLSSDDFKKSYGVWLEDLRQRKDVFLGYCSQNAGVAAQIENILVRKKATVLNFAMDFRAGLSILEEIENARSRCSCGIFIFGENDPLEGSEGSAAPRDNVVFEAGYFMSSKGPDRCLIVRIGTAKMPADLGGSIYIALGSTDVSAIEAKLGRFLDNNL